jgi:hypothetical protein
MTHTDVSTDDDYTDRDMAAGYRSQAQALEPSGAREDKMVTREYEVTVSQTRTAVVKVLVRIEAIDGRHADLARDDIYETIDRVRNLVGPLQHITMDSAAQSTGGHDEV